MSGKIFNNCYLIYSVSHFKQASKNDFWWNLAAECVDLLTLPYSIMSDHPRRRTSRSYQTRPPTATVAELAVTQASFDNLHLHQNLGLQDYTVRRSPSPYPRSHYEGDLTTDYLSSAFDSTPFRTNSPAASLAESHSPFPSVAESSTPHVDQIYNINQPMTAISAPNMQ